jgi:hypothetical protein
MLKEGLATKWTTTQVNKVSGYQVIMYSRVAIKMYIKDAQGIT